MPELHFTLRWPDGSLQRCYSPSRSVKEQLEPGASYPLADFLQRSSTALERASDRVRERHGFACTSAAQQLDAIRRTARPFGDQPGACVEVMGFEE